MLQKFWCGWCFNGQLRGVCELLSIMIHFPAGCTRVSQGKDVDRWAVPSLQGARWCICCPWLLTACWDHTAICGWYRTAARHILLKVKVVCVIVASIEFEGTFEAMHAGACACSANMVGADAGMRGTSARRASVPTTQARMWSMPEQPERRHAERQCLACRHQPNDVKGACTGRVHNTLHRCMTCFTHVCRCANCAIDGASQARRVSSIKYCTESAAYPQM